jgi:hypothetical protein
VKVRVRVRVRVRNRVTLEQHIAAVCLFAIVNDPIVSAGALLQLEEWRELVKLHLRTRLDRSIDR